MFKYIQQLWTRDIPSDTVPSTEKMSPALFERNDTASRPALIPSQIIDLTKLQLPNGSTLHTINHFLDYHATADIDPDLSNPFLRNEQWPIYFQFQFTAPSAATMPFPVADKYTYVASKYKAQANVFFHQKHHLRRLLSESAAAKQNNVLIALEYAPLNQARFTGQLANYRHFDFILRAMLDHVCNSHDNRYHFLQFPLSERVYSRAQFLRVFEKITMSTLRVQNDPSYFLLIHLLGLVYGVTNDLHASLPAADAALLGPDQPPPDLATTSLFARVPDDVLNRLHLVLTHGSDHAIIYNLGKLKEMSTNPTLFLRVLRQVNTLKLINDTTRPADDISDDAFDTEMEQKHDADNVEPASLQSTNETNIQNKVDHLDVRRNDHDEPPLATAVQKIPTIHESNNHPNTLHSEPSTAPIIESPATPSANGQSADISQIPLDFHHQVVQQLNDKIASTPELAEISHDKVAELSKRHMAVEFAGKSIAEHLASPLPKINAKQLDFLQDKLPVGDMATSSIANLDTLYVEHGMHHDIAKTLSSFIAHGLFVTHIDETHENNEWMRRTTYKVRLSDVNGKQHAVTFALPTIDASGHLLVNGIKSRMVKQQINLPICKISATRVNLSSNYNKTLVERTTTRRHNFSTYFTSYLMELRKAKLVTVQYGKLEPDPTPLPYDYSAIGQTYTRIDGEAGWLRFDYPHRFDGLSTSTLSHEAYDTTIHLSAVSIDVLATLEKKIKGVFCGVAKDGLLLFMGMDNGIIEVYPESLGRTRRSLSIMQLLHEWYPDASVPTLVSEWTEIKILDQNFPLIFVLGFRYGLSAILAEKNVATEWYAKGTKFALSINKIAIPFADGTLVINRYPLENSLIVAGLLKFSTDEYQRAEFDTPDVYYRILMREAISINYLKGITSFFDLFLDPITVDVLREMGEPTTVRELLFRASAMLSTYSHHAAASMRHHRLRGYERFSGVLYNEMSRQLAAYHAKRQVKKSFSINPEAVFQRIMQDATVQTAETTNPIHEIKNTNAFTYAGSGGRTSKSFVVEDRRYPTDGVGVMSEATVDSGKVAMSAYTSANPKIINLRGMYATEEENLTPANILSTTALLMPCSVQDDGKRVSYLSIQMSHTVPCENYAQSRVRTGYEMTIAQQSSEDFAGIAKQDGTVVAIDETLKLVKIAYKAQLAPTDGQRSLPYTDLMLKQALAHSSPLVVLMTEDELKNFPPYKTFSVANLVNVELLESITFATMADIPDKVARQHMTQALGQQLRQHPEKPIIYARFAVKPRLAPPVTDLFSYKTTYTSVSGAYLQQKLQPNLTVGETVHRGDVVVYNPGFFSADPDSKQVLWNHGIPTTIALIEMGQTLEDSCIITKELGEKLRMAPAHMRQITLTANTVLHKVVDIGEHIESTDPLCVIEEGDIEALAGADDIDTLSFLSDLNRKILKAKYHGEVVDVALYYGCPVANLHPSLQRLARKLAQRKARYREASHNTLKSDQFEFTQQIAVGTKYRGVTFEADTVLLLIMISESLSAGIGDKICIGLQAKSVIGEVTEKPPASESGVAIDLIFSSSSIANRIILSPFLVGIGNRILEKMERDIIAMYFE